MRKVCEEGARGGSGEGIVEGRYISRVTAVTRIPWTGFMHIPDNRYSN